MALVSLIQKDNTRLDFVQGISAFLAADLKFKSQFPNFGDVRVSTVHPFAVVNNAAITGGNMPNIFPCIAVSIVSEALNKENMMGKRTEIGFLTQALLTSFALLPADRRLVAQETLTTLQGYITAGREMRTAQFDALYNGRIVLSIWTENDEVKDCLYQTLKGFLEVYLEALLLNNGWSEIDWQSDRDGLFNFDLGKMLYGASITLTGVRQMVNYQVQTDPATYYTEGQAPIIGINAVEDGITF